MLLLVFAQVGLTFGYFTQNILAPDSGYKLYTRSSSRPALTVAEIRYVEMYVFENRSICSYFVCRRLLR